MTPPCRCCPSSPLHLLLCALLLFTPSRQKLRPADAGTGTDHPPNIIFILTEDMGYADLSCSGHPYAVTPNICDRLAAEGASFHNFHVAGTTCGPSRTGFMTGRHGASFPNKVHDAGAMGAQTVTQLLREGADYRTGHVGKWHIGPKPPAQGTYGIDRIVNTNMVTGDKRGKDYFLFEGSIDFIRDSVAANEEEGARRPFYLNVWTTIAHTPVAPHESLVQLFDHVKVKEDDFNPYMHEKFDMVREMGGDVDVSMRSYLADVYSLDRDVGRLLDALDELGITNETMVLFASDHGAAPIGAGDQSNPENMMGYAGPYRGSKHNYYEGGIRVPLIVRWPGRVPAGYVNEQSLVSALDYLPTICSLAGAPYNSAMFEGEDMSDVLLAANPHRSRRLPLFFKYSGPSRKASRAILYNDWKLYYPKLSEEGTNSRLYNLASHPGENKDLKRDHPDVAEALEETLQAWMDTLPTEYSDTGDLPFDPTQPVAIIEPPLLLITPTAAPSDTLTHLPTAAPTDTQLPTAAFIPATTHMPTAAPTLEPLSLTSSMPVTNGSMSEKPFDDLGTTAGDEDANLTDGDAETSNDAEVASISASTTIFLPSSVLLLPMITLLLNSRRM